MLGRVGGGLVDLLGVSPDRCGWIEELAAKVLQQTGSGSVTVKPRQPREARSGTVRVPIMSSALVRTSAIIMVRSCLLHR
jgi:hypothetical protein